MIGSVCKRLREHLRSLISASGPQQRSSKHRPLLAESLEDRRMMAGDTIAIDSNYRVTDFNAGGAPLYHDPVVFNNKLYYLDTDSTYGAELRVLDFLPSFPNAFIDYAPNANPPPRMSLVADINPGIGDSFAGKDSGLKLVGSKLYFSAYTQDSGLELRWIDLAESTTTVRTIEVFQGIQSSFSGSMGGLVSVGNKLYFMAGQTPASQRLYWIDTTVASPQLNAVNFDMGDTSDTYISLNKVGFTAVGNKLCFVASDTQSGYELRWIDTSTSPSVVNTIDRTAGSAGTWTAFNFKGMSTVANKLYFSLPTDSEDASILGWIDTSLANPTIQTYNGLSNNYALSGTTLYFISGARDLAGGVLSWLDASQANPVLNQKNVFSTDIIYKAGTFDNGIAMAGTKLYFRGLHELYWIDTSLAAPIANAITSTSGERIWLPYSYTDSRYGSPKAVGNKIYFAGRDSEAGTELRWIDATLSDPVVNTIDANNLESPYGVASSNPGEYGGFITVGDKIVFTLRPFVPNYIEDVASGSSYLVSADVMLTPPLQSVKLAWIDLTSSPSNYQFMPLGAASGDSRPSASTKYTAVGHYLFFNALDSEGNLRTRWIDTLQPNSPILTIDATPYYAVTDIPGIEGVDRGFTVVGTKVFFPDKSGQLKWVDTSEDQLTLHTLSAEFRWASQTFTVIGNKLFAFVSNSTESKLSWIDTSLDVPVINTVDASINREFTSYASSGLLAAVGDRLFFYAKVSGHDSLVWLDTTQAQSVVHPVAGESYFTKSYVIGNRLYLTDYYNNISWLDASAADPQLHALNVTSVGLYYELKQVGNKLYFDARDSVSNTQSLYWIDSSSDQPTRVAGVYELAGNGTSKQFQMIGNYLYFDAAESGSDLNNRSIRWVDTSVSNQVMQRLDLSLETNSQATVVATYGNRIYFVANDTRFGKEIRWIDTTNPTTQHVVDISSGPESTYMFSPYGYSRVAPATIANGKMYINANKQGFGSEVVIVDLYEGGTEIKITYTSANEDVAVGTNVATIRPGNFTGVDPFTYALAPAGDDNDNDLFIIQGNKLVVNKPLDYETRPFLSIRVIVTDAANKTFERTITFEVRNVEEAPVATPDIYEVWLGTRLQANDPDGKTNTISRDNGVLANDHDSDRNLITATLVTPPVNGTLTLNPDGTFTYTPASNATVGQTETFTYRVTDSTGRSADTTVQLRIVAKPTSAFHNPLKPTDVVPGTNPGVTTSLDALAIINLLNSRTNRTSIPIEELNSSGTINYYDVNNDSFVSSLDLLAVINHLNSQSAAVGEGEAQSASIVNQTTAPSSASLYDAAIVDLTELPNKKRS